MKWLLAILLVLFAETGLCLQEQTRANLELLEDKLREHVEDAYTDKSQLSPLTIVEVKSEEDDASSLLNALVNHLGKALRASILVCDSCLSNYAETEERSVYTSGFSDILEIKQIYEQAKIKAKPKAAVWVSQSQATLSIRIVALDTSQVLFADTVDSGVDWSARSMRSFSQSRKAERAARGDAILHGHWDVGINPFGGGSHLGYSIMQQWGSANQYLSGLSFNITDPILGFGLNTFKAFPEFQNMLMGGKFLVSVPEALSDAFSSSDDSGEDKTNTYTIVAMVKYPLFSQPEKFYVNGFISTNGAFGIGLSW